MRLFDAHGYDAVTMEQIAQAGDVAKGTLYSHFPVKEALVGYWVHQELTRDLANLALQLEQLPTFGERMSVLLNASREWCEENRRYLPIYLRFRFMDIGAAFPAPRMQTLDGLGHMFGTLIQLAQTAGELRQDVPADHLAELLSHLYLGALMRWLGGEGRALDREFEAILDVFMDGAALGESRRGAL